MNLEQTRKLSPEEINAAIALAVGWTVGPEGWWSAPGREGTGDDPDPPDFFHDLNACHEAAKRLSIVSPKEGIQSEWTKYHFLISGTAKTMREIIDAPASIRAIALAVVLSERKS